MPITQTKKLDTLKNSYEFSIVFKHGARFNKDFMAVYAMPLRDFLFHLRKKRQHYREIESCLLLGFSINKKVAKACKRNLLRRRIKAIMQDYKTTHKGYIFVFVCRKGIMEHDFLSLSQHITYSMKWLTQQKPHNKRADAGQHKKHVI